MITLTIGELLDGFELGMEGLGHHVYIVRDGDVVFYVGRSGDPLDRLRTHMGKGAWSWCTGASQLGQFIVANWPESRDWQVELLTVADCATWIRALCPGYILERCESDVAEQAAIVALHPCLNTIYNEQPSAIPKRYKRSLLDPSELRPPAIYSFDLSDLLK